MEILRFDLNKRKFAVREGFHFKCYVFKVEMLELLKPYA